MELLQRMFPVRLISLRGDDAWPPRLPDLSECHFLLWDYLKSKVFIDKPRSLPELRGVIHREITAIPENMLYSAMRSVIYRILGCVDTYMT